MCVSSLKRFYVVKTALQFMFDGRIRIIMKFCIEIHNPVIKDNQGLCMWERFWLAVGGITDRHMGYIRSGTQQSVKAKNGGHDGSFGKGCPNNYWSTLPYQGFAKVWRKSENIFWQWSGGGSTPTCGTWHLAPDLRDSRVGTTPISKKSNVSDLAQTSKIVTVL